MLSTCQEDCWFWRFISIDHIKWLFKDKVVIAHSVVLVFFLPTWDKTPPLPPIVVYKCKPKSLVIAQTNHTQQGSGYPCQAFFLTTSFMFCVWGRTDRDLAYPECFLFAGMIRIGCRNWIRKPWSLSLHAAPNCDLYAVRFRAAYCTQNQRFLRGKWKY